MTDTLALEERIAHLTRALDDLSDVAARQEREIAILTRRVGWLYERAAEQQEDESSVTLADQRPPHW
ncbi:SlyX family protein [Pseudoroseicyclus aestuarii]|uniref:SlyX protein n=1 Tax=Pseudoroseicyclus aestuarii TaxID=1795041 RepID=A0A318SYW1_9RHOB|nr:SlyX family protein [Pseudoroseicyclus aestuarii]PYE85586.1 SlyX protein [Pseudoroseicyclus aestuarii]